jgi:hypothetical protein
VLFAASGTSVTGGKTGKDSNGKPVVTYTNLTPGKYTPKGGIPFMPETPGKVKCSYVMNKYKIVWHSKIHVHLIYQILYMMIIDIFWSYQLL